ncbi:MAG: hypothetical protein ACJ8D7_14100, partial [Xanthobacteraceae bacterium]
LILRVIAPSIVELQESTHPRLHPHHRIEDRDDCGRWSPNQPAAGLIGVSAIRHKNTHARRRF